MTHRGDHDLQVLRHADRGDDRIERKHQIDDHELNARSRRRPPWWRQQPAIALARLDLGMNFMRRLGDEEQAAADQDDVPPGNAHVEEGYNAAR